MVADKREFIRLDVGYFDNPKVGEALDVSHAAVVLHIASMAYARQHRTDGLVPAKRVMRKVGATQDDAQTLIDAGLWHDRDGGKVEVHDYAKHQETREEIEAKSKAARKAIRTRWDREKGTGGTTDRNTDRSSDRSTDGTSERNTEERRGEESKPATQAGTDAGREDGTDGPQNAMAILASLGLITADLRRSYLTHLKDRGIERPTRFIVTMHGRGELRGEVEDWQAERDVDNVVSLRPKPVQHNTASREHLEGCRRCRRMVGVEDPTTGVIDWSVIA